MCMVFFHYQYTGKSNSCDGVAAKCSRGCVSCGVKICQFCTIQEVTKVRRATVSKDRCFFEDFTRRLKECGSPALTPPFVVLWLPRMFRSFRDLL